MTQHWDQIRATLARRFFVATGLQAALGGLIAWALIWLHGPVHPAPHLVLPSAFQFGTALLCAGSWFLHQAVQFVRVERQLQFRRSLVLALAAAVLFVGVQSYGMFTLVKGVVDFRETQTNVHGFVFMIAALHGMHFLVAQSVLLWITLCALADRYDHEYYWGVVFASWCWHVLGIVWLAILCVFAIAAR